MNFPYWPVAIQFMYEPLVMVVDEMQAHYLEGVSQRQLIADTFPILLAEHLHVRANSAEDTSTLLSSRTDQTLVYRLPCLLQSIAPPKQSNVSRNCSSLNAIRISFISIYVLAPNEENFWREFVYEIVVY